ncbi:MAG: CpsD/CapB family tyrosine-protein kinase [Thermoguttaceae bacterium]|jgi:Mrp family chromosome partitioning ATPase
MGLMLDALKRIDGRLPAECPQEPPATCDDNRALSDGTGQPFESWWDASCGEDHPLLGALDAMPDLPAPELQSAGQAPPPNAPEPQATEQSPPVTRHSSLVTPDPYQDLAGSILAEVAPGRPRAVAFASPTDGPETTAVLARLAAVLAEQVEGGVLLVDADFRRPRLAGELGVDAATGLGEVLSGKANWSDAVRPTAVPRLHLLPGGPVPPQEGGATEQPDLGRLVRDLVRHYALVLVAAGSLAHHQSAAVAGACEGTYLLAPLGQVTRPAVRRAAHLLQQCHARLLGCVAVGPSC